MRKLILHTPGTVRDGWPGILKRTALLELGEDGDTIELGKYRDKYPLGYIAGRSLYRKVSSGISHIVRCDSFLLRVDNYNTVDYFFFGVRAIFVKERQRENARMFLRGRDGILQVCQDLFYQGWTVTMEWYDNPWKDMYHEEIQ